MMFHFVRRNFCKIKILLCLILLSSINLLIFSAQKGNEPVIVKTPWGQSIVPGLSTYATMKIYMELKPGQSWSEGRMIRKRLEEDYQEGALRLRVHPWRISEDVFVLGQDDKEMFIYLLDTGKGLLLIDPSFDSWHDDIIMQINELGYRPSQVRWVLVTHCHVDHAQSCHLWRKKGAEILAPKEDAHPIETGNQITAWWLEEGHKRHFIGCPVDRLVHDGDRLDFGDMTFYAIWTPGHTPGSTCYYLHHKGKHILFSEDIALHNGRFAWMDHPYADWDLYLKSLHKLVNYTLNGIPVEFDVLLPGHGAADMDGAMRSLRETVRLVSYVIKLRQAGKKITWIEPYQWNWEQGNIYR